jgi:glycosyltransferase involved in cell wall biosynthesis
VRRLALYFDPPDEAWDSMQLCGEMLASQLETTFAGTVALERLSTRLPRLARRLPAWADRRPALNADRVAGRFVTYPAFAAAQRRRFDLFHVVDHSYAQIVHLLPRRRTGVFCHDIDAFRSLLPAAAEARSPWFRAMQRVILTGMQRAALIFHTTFAVREEIERWGIAPRSRLVHAPLGIAPEYTADPLADDVARGLLAPLRGEPYLFHVGSNMPRKRLDVLLGAFARLHARFPRLHLVQHGAALLPAQRAILDANGAADRFHQVAPPGGIDRATLAGLHRHAQATLVTSDAEGFGLPVIEALACGTPVFATDIDVLHEVGGNAALYCPPGDPEAWAESLARFLRGELHPPPRDQRLARAAIYTWTAHARAILDAYAALPLAD